MSTHTTNTQQVAPTSPTTLSMVFDEKQYALFIHLSIFAGFLIPFGNIIAPVILWSMKRKESEYIDYHGKEVINFQISIMILAFISVLTMFILIGIPLIVVTLFACILLPVLGAIAANNGERYKYPFIFRFVK